MDNMIKFYRGLVGNLPETGVNGALYITTDEGAIYYGTGTGMKRLGDFVQVANVAALPEKAHESCLYYCVAENILAKWNGTEWKQINKQPTAEELKGLLGLGSLAYLSEVSEANLNADLAAKINASTAVNHSHDNKTVLDGITADKVAAWDASEKNAKDYTDGKDSAMNTRVEALETAIGENGSVATQIKTAIEDLDYTDTAVDGEYVSAVNEVDGKISVTRKALPDYSNTYDVKGAADTAFENAKAYADGLAANYDEKGAAAGVKTELEAEIAKKVDKVEGKSLVLDTEITKLAGVSAGANKVEASENGKIKIDGVDTVVYTHPDKHAIADVDGLQAALDGKQAAGNYSVEGHKHVKADITDFAHTHTASEVTDLDATIKGYDYATKTELGDVDAKFANYKTAEAQKAIDDEQDRRLGVIEGDYLKAADIADFETKENVKKVSDDLAAYIESNDAAVADRYTKAEADGKFALIADAYDDEEVRGLISDNADAIAAEESRAKGVEESLQTQINTIMNNPDAEGAINSINEFTQYVKDHGTIAEGMRTDINKNKEDIAANAKAIEDQATADAAKYETKDDATAKLGEAKTYADGLNTAMDTRVKVLEGIDHDAYIAADSALKTELQGEIDADVKVVADDLAAYKTSNDAEVAKKANSADVYTKTETYTKEEINALFTWGEF
jgi:hypothetical protein